MYIPRSFKEEKNDVLYDLIRENSFGILVTQKNDTPKATHLPFMIEPDRGEQGTLVTHMARANKHWRNMDDDTEALAIFRGPHSYISPSWYKNQVTVPTWNYAAVHVYGKARLVHQKARLREIVTDLVHFHESQADSEWTLDLAEPKMDTMLKAIVGIEIPIERIDGNMKFNQNRSRKDRLGVIKHLSDSGDPVKQEIAEIMRTHLNN